MAYVMYLIPKVIHDRLEMIRKIRNHFAHSPSPAEFTDAQSRERLHILATGKSRLAESTKSNRHILVESRKISKERFYYICVIAQTATVIELMESLLQKHGDIRAIVLLSEKTGAFEYDKDAA